MQIEGSIVGPINLGNQNEFTIKELAEKVISLTGSTSNLTYHDLPSDDPKQRRPDTKLAVSLLNWEAKIELIEGLSLLIEDFRLRLG